MATRAIVWASLVSLGLLASCRGGGHTGTYVLDKSALPGGAAKDDLAKKLFEDLNVEVKLNGDGTFKSTIQMPDVMGMGSKPGSKKLEESGTWVADGEKLTFTTKDHDGKKVNETKTCTIKDGVITLNEMGMEVRLVKR